LPNQPIEDGTTIATAHFPGMEMEIIHRRLPEANTEQISINLRAVPSFEAFGRILETANPFVFWVRAAQLAWMPWLGAANTLMLPWSGLRKSHHEGRQGRAESARRQHQEEALDDALKNTFPASDPVSIEQPAPPDTDFNSGKTGGSRSMDEREAFWAAVYKFTSPEWSPDFADQPTFDVRHYRSAALLSRRRGDEGPAWRPQANAIVRPISNIRDRIPMFITAIGGSYRAAAR
jgi:hypothetical protein